MEHSEAAMTFSAKVQNLRVAYNEIRNVHEKGIGNFANDDFDVEITDNLLSSSKETIGYIGFYNKDSLNTIYNNKNLNFANGSQEDCLIQAPQATENSICSGFSSVNNPLEIGDTLTITFDSIKVLSTKKNFLKCIEPLYSNEFFSLESISLRSEKLSSYHSWNQSLNTDVCSGLIFDNGHRDGILASGNWGYEGCSTNDCTLLTLIFIVQSLPETTGQVDCPLSGLSLMFDGDLGTWNYNITCINPEINFEQSLGSPFLNGTTSSVSELQFSELSVSPNPAASELFLNLKKNSKLEFLVRSVDGQIVKEGSTNKTSIMIENLETGIYFITFLFEDDVITKRFIKL